MATESSDVTIESFDGFPGLEELLAEFVWLKAEKASAIKTTIRSACDAIRKEDPDFGKVDPLLGTCGDVARIDAALAPHVDPVDRQYQESRMDLIGRMAELVTGHLRFLPAEIRLAALGSLSLDARLCADDLDQLKNAIIFRLLNDDGPEAMHRPAARNSELEHHPI